MAHIQLALLPRPLEPTQRPRMYFTVFSMPSQLLHRPPCTAAGSSGTRGTGGGGCRRQWRSRGRTGAA